ncbi:tyrosine-type recombinase/integrase [Syntrophothermus sp.]|uniref:tyrosine-type recombinase/integrase n=1 Tax=Syntrophothermus sp. TaxID=2736299 RepID=UPI00257BAEF3|nr:tyrosine-type recombinase/integrase [Syntrophothermus sp.]
MYNLFAPFLLSLHSAGMSKNTIKNYQIDLEHFAQWYLETIGEEATPDRITSLDLAEYQQYLATRDFKPASINRRMAALRKYLKWAAEENIIKQVPKFPKGVSRVKLAPRALKRNEMNALLRAVMQEGNKRDLAIIMTLMYCGLRVSELVSLKISDLELKERAGKITVRGKGNKTREVPVPHEVREALRDYLTERKDRYQELFLGQRGPLTVLGVQQMLKKYAYAAKIENLSPHVLRHTCATYYLNKGMDLVKVAALLGHKNLNTTMVYTSPSFDDLAWAMEGKTREEGNR